MKKLIRALSLLLALLGLSGAGLGACVVQAINLGETRSGALTTDDCIDHNGNGHDYYYNRYEFNATSGQKIAISNSSTAIDVDMLLIYPDNTSTYGNDSGNDTNARIPASGYLTLSQTGRYVIAPSSALPLQTGAYTLTLAAASTTVVEYYNPDLDNYFIAADPTEQLFVDSGAVGRWQRTGTTFLAGGANLACRFYGSPLGPNSHFYTADSQECSGLRSIYDPSVKSWKFESYDFYIDGTVNGTCAAGRVPIYRAYNNGFARRVDSNHRISPRMTDIQQVVTRGWTYEGIVMCGNGDGAPATAGSSAQVVALFPVKPTDLPVLRISTKDAAPIVSKEVYVDATYVLTNPATPDQPMSLNGKIRGRGNSTWGQPKNPYKVQFSNDAKYAAIADVLGMKKNRNWALLADYFDRSLMRNRLALSLAKSSVFSDGLKWSPSGQHIEVYLNDEYVGAYLLTEDIRIDPARLNIRTMSPSPTANQIDGGYIVEVDSRLDCYNSGAINLQHVTPQGAPICIAKPDEDSITQDQLSYIKSLLDTVEADIYVRGSMDRINPASFADWYLIQELFRNNDAAFFSSDFMWKDTDGAAAPADRLLNMGPVWDFDSSAGNINFNDNWEMNGCWVSKQIDGYPSNWISRLLYNPAFRDLVLARWKQKRPALESFINSSIGTYARQLELPQQRNFAKWPIIGVQLASYYTFTTYAAEVGFLKAFLNQRMAWLDEAFASPEDFDSHCR
ncbi:MAG: CotH kinase family protein [Betaproteobacteria bacterium]|nr:CotH kinase family protein [Betaproteobacteria bacterium]